MAVRTSWEVIVIGSGIGGLACAAALAKSGHAVLVLEQHQVAGGLTQTFARQGFRWDVGLHYLGEMGPEGEAYPILDWLTAGAIQFASLGPVYDTFHFPEGFEISFARPQAALQAELKERFPRSVEDIDTFFAAVNEAQSAGRALMTTRVMPGPLLASMDSGTGAQFKDGGAAAAHRCSKNSCAIRSCVRCYLRKRATMAVRGQTKSVSAYPR